LEDERNVRFEGPTAVIMSSGIWCIVVWYRCLPMFCLKYLLFHPEERFNIVARMWRLYETGIGLTTGFIGSHTVTHNYSVDTLTASQFTIVLAESPYNYNWLSQLSLFRAEDLLQTQLALTGHQLTLQPNSHLRLLTWVYYCPCHSL
jgi:hypothetical protein